MDTAVNHNNTIKTFREGMVHVILTHSYLVFFFAVMIGVLLDIFVPIKIFNGVGYEYYGLVMIVLGTILIYWSQASSGASKKDMVSTDTHREFARGPYKYSRNPTHIGLTMMTLGLGFLLNSLFIVIFILITSLITKLIFLHEEENWLAKKYGQPYLDYKKKVHTWV